MLGVVGRIQREGDVVHVVVYKLIDLSVDLATVGGRDAPFPLPHGSGDEFARRPSPPDPRDPAANGLRARDIYVPDMDLGPIRPKTRDFR
jgi:error-prone DNA polymerase